VEESRNRLESMSDAVLEIAISKAKDPELIKKLRKEAERRGYSFPVPGQSIGEWADEIQVAAYEEEPEQSLEPILPYLERIYPYVVNALLEKDVGDQIYAVMVRNMTQTELELALEAETRPEGLKLLKAEAANRGLIDPEPEPPAAAGQGAQMVPIELLYPNPANPRKRFDQDELDKLTASVRQLGVLSPILVVQDGDQYRIVAGERRYRAATAAGLNEVPVLVRELTEAEEFEVMLTENIQRADLDPIEEAQAFAEAVSRGWKQTELAERLGISQAQVANRLRLLKLPEAVQEDISREILSAGHGLALVKVAHVPEMAKEIVSRIAEDGVPVSQAGELVDHFIACDGKPLFTGVFDEPEFNTQEICIKTKCKMRVHGKHRFSSTEHPYCLDPECWERHQDEATKKKLAEKLQEAANENGLDISELLILDDLPWDSYEVFRTYTSIKIEDCHDDCEHLKDAIKRGEAVKACLKPECWKEKEKAIKREQNKEKKENAQAFEAKKDNILQMCSMHNQLPRKILIYMATQAISDPPTSGVTTWTKDKIRKQLYIDRGWKLPNLDDRTWPYPDEIKDLISHLKELPDRELLDVILYGLLRGITEDDTIYELTLGTAQKETREAEEE
jgi:ParB family chromosome partitioning protein